MIKKIKKLFVRKPYCKYCKWHIPTMQVSDNKFMDNVCGYTIETEINEIGIETIRRYGDVQRCEMCGNIEHDYREIRVMKCLVKNKDLACINFTSKLLYKIFKFVKPKA